MSILDTAQPAVDTVESVNALIYGDSGAGKTYFACLLYTSDAADE